MIKLYISSAKSGHETLEFTSIQDAMTAARAELDRGRWLYTSTDNGIQRLEANDINEGYFQNVEELFSQPVLQGG